MFENAGDLAENGRKLKKQQVRVQSQHANANTDDILQSYQPFGKEKDKRVVKALLQDAGFDKAFRIQSVVSAYIKISCHCMQTDASKTVG